MRIRHKKWALPELSVCPYFIPDAVAQRGRWREAFACPASPLYLELGCGKGMFVAQLAPETPQINYLALDLKSDILGVARRNIASAFGEAPVENLLLSPWDIERIDQALAPVDRVERIYINFCNPWPVRSQHKHRLTHPRQLRKYRALMAPEALLVFKTDDDALFGDTLEYLAEAGFETLYVTWDLHRDGPPAGIPSPQTEHERMFSSQGVPIKFLTARVAARQDSAPSFLPGQSVV